MYLKKIIKNSHKKLSFHTPGHKGKYDFFEGENYLNFDLTEFGDLDNLHAPTGCIKDILKRISKLFGSSESFILVNGSTVGILASMLYAKTLSNEILIGRNCHKSVFNGLYIADLAPIYLYPYLNQQNMVTHFNLSELEEIFSTSENCKAVLITSPTYEGIVMDIKNIAMLAHKHDKILIVDEAHGSHFKFSNQFPDTALSLGADIVINSIHKTLPAFTQTALLHINSSINSEKMFNFISMLQTTSPSYMFMYAIDKLMYDLEYNQLNFEEYTENLNTIRGKISTLQNLVLYQGETNIIDKSRLILYTYNGSVSHLEGLLSDKFNIQIEMSTENYIVLISTVMDSVEDFNCLFHALQSIDNIYTTLPITKEFKTPYSKNKSVISYKDAINSPGKYIPIISSNNKISKNFIIPYPPGIPIVAPGEIITEEIITYLQKATTRNITNIIGIKNDLIQIVDTNI